MKEAEAIRDPECKNYYHCLDVAARANAPEMDCRSCDGNTKLELDSVRGCSKFLHLMAAKSDEEKDIIETRSIPKYQRREMPVDELMRKRYPGLYDSLYRIEKMISDLYEDKYYG